MSNLTATTVGGAIRSDIKVDSVTTVIRFRQGPSEGDVTSVNISIVVDVFTGYIMKNGSGWWCTWVWGKDSTSQYSYRLHTTNKTRNPTMQYIHVYVSCSIEYVCVLFLSRDIQNGVYVLYSIGQDSTTNNCIVILIAVACERNL